MNLQQEIGQIQEIPPVQRIVVAVPYLDVFLNHFVDLAVDVLLQVLPQQVERFCGVRDRAGSARRANTSSVFITGK